MKQFKIQLWVLLISFIAFTSNAAEIGNEKEGYECELEMLDLTEALELNGEGSNVALTKLTTPIGNSPVKRYVQTEIDGSTIILEQSHCLIYNLEVVIVLPNHIPLKDVPVKLAKILNHTVVWQKWFSDYDAEQVLDEIFEVKQIYAAHSKYGTFDYGIDDELSADGENSEINLTFLNLERSALPFNRVISLYIGVGGL